MTVQRDYLDDPRMQSAVDEIQGVIRRRYPDATFEVGPGEDPEGLYIVATVDVEDMFDVLDLVSSRLVDLQVEERLPLYLIPSGPLARTIEMLQASRARERR